jgi:hypothetical protein
MSAMRIVVLVVLAGAVSLAGCGGPEPPPFKAVVDTKLLMQSVVDPNADLIWEAVKTIDSAQGVEDIRPRTDEQWTAVRNAAVAVTESGNLLMMSPRAKDGGEWMKRAQDMVSTGEAAIRAAEAKNPERLFSVGGDIYEACSHCHREYLDAIVNANK